MKIKNTVCYSINIIVGFCISFFIPTGILLAFNLLKWPGNNLDGEIFTPIGWLVIWFFCGITALILLLDFKRLSNKLFEKTHIPISVVCFLAGLVIGVIVINCRYSNDYTWLFKCFFQQERLLN